MDGIALAWSEVPLELIERYGLSRLAHERGGERELRFLRHHCRALLPVWHCGQLRIVPWGRVGGGLTWQQSVDAGLWENAEPVEIRASAGWDGGVWFRIRQGVRGLLVETPQELASYVIVEPATYYYRVMTRRERMPVLIGERI